jgi:hypothetical protein
MLEIDSLVDAVVESVEAYGVYLRHGEDRILVLAPDIASATGSLYTPTEFSVGQPLQVKILLYVTERTYRGLLRLDADHGFEFRSC